MADLSQPISGIAEVNGAHLAYDMTGNGPALVLIHAGIADRRMWDDQIPALNRDYRVLRYDLRGYGESDIPPEPFAHHDDLAGLLQHLRIDQAHILGVSQGGKVAIDFTLSYPAMVTSLIRVSSGVGEQEPSAILQRAWGEMEQAEEAEGLGRVLELELQLWVDGPTRSEQAVNTKVRDRVREMNAALFERIPQHEAAEESSLDPPAIERLTEIQAPTLIIVGDKDVPDVLAIAELMETQISNSRKVIFPDAAHMVSMERPDEFNRVVMEFLNSLPTV
jgi:3-oxoadipate enol-lactonase